MKLEETKDGVQSEALKNPGGDVSEQFIHVEVKNSWSGLQGAGVGGPSTPPGRRILPPQIPTGLVGLTLLYKDTQRRDETVVSDYQSTNTDIFKSQ